MKEKMFFVMILSVIIIGIPLYADSTEINQNSIGNNGLILEANEEYIMTSNIWVYNNYDYCIIKEGVKLDFDGFSLILTRQIIMLVF